MSTARETKTPIQLKHGDCIKLPLRLQMLLQTPQLKDISHKFIVGKTAEYALLVHRGQIKPNDTEIIDLDITGTCDHGSLIKLGFAQNQHNKKLYKTKIGKVKIDFYLMHHDGIKEDYKSRSTTDSALYIQEEENANGRSGILHDPSGLAISDILVNKVRLINPSLLLTHVQVLRLIKKLCAGKKIDHDFLSDWQPPTLENATHFHIKTLELFKNKNIEKNYLILILKSFKLLEKLFGISNETDSHQAIKLIENNASFKINLDVNFQFYKKNSINILDRLKNIIDKHVIKIIQQDEFNIDILNLLFKNKFSYISTLENLFLKINKQFSKDEDLLTAIQSVQNAIDSLKKIETITITARKSYAQFVKSMYTLAKTIELSMQHLPSIQLQEAHETKGINHAKK